MTIYSIVTAEWRDVRCALAGARWHGLAQGRLEHLGVRACCARRSEGNMDLRQQIIQTQSLPAHGTEAKRRVDSTTGQHLKTHEVASGRHYALSRSLTSSRAIRTANSCSIVATPASSSVQVGLWTKFV